MRILDTLRSSHRRTWHGEGTNHAGEVFSATLIAETLFEGDAIEIWFKATGMDGTVYHEALLHLGPDGTGRMTMTSASTNVPFLQHFDAAMPADGALAIALDHGDHTTRAAYRETIEFADIGAGGIAIAFRCGMPGEEVVTRSRVELLRKPV